MKNFIRMISQSLARLSVLLMLYKNSIFLVKSFNNKNNHFDK